jgi:glutamyl/glutaminyl-tRNA synthetase
MADDSLGRSLEKSKEVLQSLEESEWTLENITEKLLKEADKPARNAAHSVAGGRGDLLWPLRVALTGAQKSPSPFEVAWVLGKEESLKRIQNALAIS